MIGTCDGIAKRAFGRCDRCVGEEHVDIPSHQSREHSQEFADAGPRFNAIFTTSPMRKKSARVTCVR